jgi:hypothetical protein
MHIRSYGCTLSLRCTENRYTFKLSYFHTTEWMIVALRQGINFSAISWREQVTFRWDYAMFAGLEFFSASSLRKQSAGGKHVSPLAQIILILSQSVFGLTSQCLVEKQQISIPITYLRFDRWLNPRGEHTNHYSINAVYRVWVYWKIMNSNADIIQPMWK